MSTRFIVHLSALPVLLLATSLAVAQAPIAEETVASVDETAPGKAVAPPIIIDSDTSESDLRAGITRFRDNVTIQRGAMLVKADEGVIHQVDGRMTRIELFGSPTTWRDQLEDGSMLEGRADRIEYAVNDNVLTLSGDARLQHEGGEFTGNQLVYDLDTESLAGRGSEDNQVRVVIEGDAMQRRNAENKEPSAQPEPDADGEASAEDQASAEQDDPADPPADG